MRFETLIAQYHDEIYSYLWRLMEGAWQVDHLADAQDLTQEVFLRAYQSFDRLRPNSNHRAWLYKIATHCAYTAIKRSRRTGQIMPMPEDDEGLTIPADASPSPYQVAARRETLSFLQSALANLPVKQQAAVLMRHIQGLDYVEISHALDCSEESARANVYQALRRLRRELGSEGDLLIREELGDV